ncbi:MAG: PEP-CTERM sorting domain-containing protein, partial [Burkholderiales bacterium]
DQELLDANNSVIMDVKSLHAVIDGTSILEQDLFAHLETSPIFQFTAAQNNPFGVSPGPSGKALAQGYYLMLAPLGTGTHTISYGGKYVSGDFIFETDANATISGVPEPASLTLVATSLMGLAWARRRVA